MFCKVLLVLTMTSAASKALEEGFEPLDAECFTSARLLICSQYSSIMFDTCVKTSELHMFYYHRPTQQICGGQSLGACVSGDFCEQPRHGDVIMTDAEPKSQEPKKIIDINQRSTVPQPLSSSENNIEFRSIPVEDKSFEIFSSKEVKDKLSLSRHRDRNYKATKPHQGRDDQRSQESKKRPMLSQLGSVFVSIIVLGSIVVLLFFAIIIFMIRDARHRTQRNMLGQMLYQAHEDRAQWLNFFSLRREAERYWEPREAAEDAEAAAQGQVVPIRVPLSVRHNLVAEDRKNLQSFGPPLCDSASGTSENSYPKGINPFGDDLSSNSSLQPLGQPQSEKSFSAANSIEKCPEIFSAASAGIRAKLEEIFEPEPSRDCEKLQLPQEQPLQLVVQAEVHPTATIQRRPSYKKKRAPPPPTLPKPKMEVVAADAKASSSMQTFARTQSTARRSQTRRAPSPPKRSSSLRSLNSIGRNSLRRAPNLPLQASKLDLSTKFMEKNDLYSEEEQFVSYVTDA